jgi:Holliday junction resolvasome RuvABC DNA-binding subunit
VDHITSLIVIAAGDATALAATRGISAKWARRIAFVLLACGICLLFT